MVTDMSMEFGRKLALPAEVKEMYPLKLKMNEVIEKRNAQIVLLRVCPLASDIDHLRPRADCTLSANAQSRTETHDGDDYALPKNPVQI